MKLYFIGAKNIPLRFALRDAAHSLATTVEEAWMRFTGVYRQEGGFCAIEQSYQENQWSSLGFGPRCVEVSEFVVDESSADVLGKRKKGNYYPSVPDKTPEGVPPPKKGD